MRAGHMQPFGRRNADPPPRSPYWKDLSPIAPPRAARDRKYILDSKLLPAMGRGNGRATRATIQTPVGPLAVVDAARDPWAESPSRLSYDEYPHGLRPSTLILGMRTPDVGGGGLTAPLLKSSVARSAARARSAAPLDFEADFHGSDRSHGFGAARGATSNAPASLNRIRGTANPFASIESLNGAGNTAKSASLAQFPAVSRLPQVQSAAASARLKAKNRSRLRQKQIFARARGGVATDDELKKLLSDLLFKLEENYKNINPEMSVKESITRHRKSLHDNLLKLLRPKKSTQSATAATRRRESQGGLPALVSSVISARIAALSAVDSGRSVGSPGSADGKRPKKPCNCRKSRCLKLYCECFARQQYCDGCNCDSCENSLQNETKRQFAVLKTLERDPDAFFRATATEPGEAKAAQRLRGCHCKKSGCKKKYCECFQAGVPCGPLCKCVGCRNGKAGGDAPVDSGRPRLQKRKKTRRPSIITGSQKQGRAANGRKKRRTVSAAPVRA